MTQATIAPDFATTAEQRINQERRLASRAAVDVLLAGQYHRIETAASILHASVLRQARIAGVGI